MSPFFTLIWPVLAVMIVYLALIGWGWICALITRTTTVKDFGLYGGWGLALALIVGGVLNLAGLISPLTVRIFVFAGLAFLILMLILNRSILFKLPVRNTKGTVINWIQVTAIGLVAFFLLLKFVIAGIAPFNTFDDYPGYLVLPVKMLETGSLGQDPFSKARLLILGGQSWLHAIMLGWINLNQLGIVDRGLGWIVLAGLIITHCRNQSINLYWCLLIITAFIIVVPVGVEPAVNISSHVTGFALFYTLFRTVNLINKNSKEKRILDLKSMILIGIISAGIISLKTNHLPGLVLIGLTYFIFIIQNRSFRTRAYEFTLLSLITGILLTPWMANLYLSSGTLLYPVLGSGYHGTNYGYFPKEEIQSVDLYKIKAIITQIFNVLSYPVTLSIFFIVLSYYISSSESLENKRKVGLIAVAALLPSIIVAVTTEGISQQQSLALRYCYSFLYACALFLITEAIAKFPVSYYEKSIQNYNSVLLIFLSLGILLGAYWNESSMRYYYNFLAIRKGPSPVDLEQGKKELRNLQYTVPEGARMIVRLDKPFNLDFQRNLIFVTDFPCSVSLPPGLPCLLDAEAIATYLRSHSINYLMYSNETNLSKEKIMNKIPPHRPGRDAKVRLYFQYGFVFQDRLLELKDRYKTLGDDGSTFVIDLTAPAQP